MVVFVGRAGPEDIDGVTEVWFKVAQEMIDCGNERLTGWAAWAREQAEMEA